MKEQLALTTSQNFGNVQCDFWQDKESKEFWMTRDQIGGALEYNNPNDAIRLIHGRHEERINKYSVSFKLNGTDGKSYDTYLYNSKGIYEICRWSRQPKADAFMDWVWNIIDNLRTGELTLSKNNVSVTPELIDSIISQYAAPMESRIISQLTPHPKNLEIYGDEDVMELAINIEKNTLRQPILVTDKNVIISGHRRVKAYQLLGYPTIPATIQHYDSVEDEIEDLILINHTRVRSREQMAREAAMLEGVEKQRAKLRQSILNNEETACGSSATSENEDKGKARDKIAGKIGFKSGHEAERAIKTVKKIKELKKKGDSDSKCCNCL